MAKFCAKCGASLREDAKFCGKCGAEVKVSTSDQLANSKVQNNQIVQNKKFSAAKVIAIMIGIVVVIAGLIWALHLKDSTGSPSANSGKEQTNASNNAQVISDFCNDIQGVWVLSEEDNPYASVSFIIVTDDMQMTGGTYPGAYGRTCEITKVQLNSNKTIQTELYYPATEATDMDGAMPKLKMAATFESSDSFLNSLKIIYEDGTIKEFEFVASEWEQATSKLDQIIEEKQRNALESEIPTISANSTILDADFEALKIRMGYDLSGPNDSWRSNSESIFYLENMSDVECYMNISSKDELLGVKNGEIVFFGIYGLSSSSTRVKDLLPNDALTTEPAVFTIRANTAAKAGLDSYVWKLDNGYMAVIVVPMNMNFYDQYVYNVAYVTDLSYLSYIGY